MADLQISGIEELRSYTGRELGTSDWVEITQETIDAFAAATGDHQWIHVDSARAGSTPFGGTIAHGLLTLSLGPALAYSIYSVGGIAMALNYGYERIRFPAPLPSGSRVRMTATLTSVTDVPGGVQVLVTQTFEREGESKPVCVAEQVARLVAAPGS